MELFFVEMNKYNQLQRRRDEYEEKWKSDLLKQNIRLDYLKLS